MLGILSIELYIGLQSGLKCITLNYHMTVIRKEFSNIYPGVDIKNNSLSVMAGHLSLEKDPQHGLGNCKTILNITIKLLNQGIAAFSIQHNL